jgi:hypothetical protein
VDSLRWFYEPMQIFVAYPAAGLAIALLFTLLYLDIRFHVARARAAGLPPNRSVLAQSWVVWGNIPLWLTYTAYEFYIQSTGANIRIDLLMIPVALYTATVAGMVAWWIIRRLASPRPKTSSHPDAAQ